MRVKLQLDCSGLQAQLGQLSGWFERIPKGVAQAALPLCRRYQERLPLDLVVRQDMAEPGAASPASLVYSIRLGVEFENLLAALRALEEGVR